MKTVTKLATAAFLAMAAAAPAFAVEPEAMTLQERNSYLYTADARPIAQHQQNVDVRAQRGLNALAQAPARLTGISNHGAFDGY